MRTIFFISRALLALVFLFGMVARMSATTNEYYTRPEAKVFIDKVIAAHGGKENLEKIDRIKQVITVDFEGIKGKAVFYFTRSKAKRVFSGGNLTKIEVFDGTNLTVFLQGRKVSGTDPKLKGEISGTNSKSPSFYLCGVNFLEKDSDVRYLGQTNFQGRVFEAIEKRTSATTNIHYFDPSTLRRSRRLLLDKERSSLEVYLAYKNFQGVLIPSKITSSNLDNSSKGDFEVGIISDNFDDSEFVVRQ